MRSGDDHRYSRLMSVTASRLRRRRMLALLVAAVVAVCALAYHRPPGTSPVAAGDMVAASMEMGTTAVAGDTQPTVMAAGSRMAPGIHRVMDCGGTAGGEAHLREAALAVLTLSALTAPALGAGTGDELRQTCQRITPKHTV